MASRSFWSLGISLFIIIVALFGSRVQFFTQRLFGISLGRRANVMTTSKGAFAASTAAFSTASGVNSVLFDDSKPKTPVYFFSHGGPTFMYPEVEFGGDIGAYEKVKSLGKYIQSTIKPKFIIVVSAHWQSNSNDLVEIGVPSSYSKNVFNSKGSKSLLDPDELGLIYDFYGFPQHMYEEKFHTKGSVELAQDIKESLSSQKIKSKLTARGIDHGVWVPFKVAFSSNNPKNKEWDLDCPLVQISLSASDDFEFHHKLGQALAKYRSLGGVVICSGMSVHNLRDVGVAMNRGGKALNYVAKFNNLVTSVVSGSKEQERLKKFEDIQENERSLLYSAHPTLEHFMPIVVASGAASGEVGQEMYNNASLSLGWGVYQFGEYNKEKL